jgi:hypothetical protein
MLLISFAFFAALRGILFVFWFRLVRVGSWVLLEGGIMLREVSDVRQIANENPRRWFSSAEMDLTVWIDTDGSVSGFELCYDKEKDERALRWLREAGFVHERVDDGEGRPGRFKGTPILVPDGLFRSQAVAERFRGESGAIDQSIASFVYEKLLAYPAGRV